MNIFISYRRDDRIEVVKLVCNELRAEFRDDADAVFIDLDGIGYGDDFVQAIDSRLEVADVVVVLIGPRWAEMLQQRAHGDDWVRHEVGGALRLRADAARGRPRVIPLLIAGARLPIADLPDDLAELNRLNAVTYDERAASGSIKLIEAIRRKTFVERARELLQELRNRRLLQLGAVLIGFGMFFAGWIALFDFFGIDTRVATATMVLAGAGRSGEPAPWSGEVVLVAIDEGSVRAVGRDFDASWRAEHAAFIRNAAGAGARTVAIDLFLTDPGTEAVDTMLEQALAATAATMPVVLAVENMTGNTPDLLSRFGAHAKWGIACAGLKLGQARGMPLAVQRETVPPPPPTAAARGRYIVHPSLALAAFSGGGPAEPFDEWAQTARILLPREQRSQDVAYFSSENVSRVQSECKAIAKGDRVAYQLFDPLTLPPLRQPPQRLAYERVLAGDPATLAMLQDKVVLVGKQFANDDVLSSGPGGDRWGVDLIAAQIDALLRGAAIRPLGATAQWLLCSGLGFLGGYAWYGLRQRPRWQPAGALLALAALFVAASVAWYRVEQQLIGLPYGLGALALGAWAASRISRGKPT